jgi:hypothetical protein
MSAADKSKEERPPGGPHDRAPAVSDPIAYPDGQSREPVDLWKVMHVLACAAERNREPA